MTSTYPLPIIQRCYHYSTIYLGPHVIQGKALCGQTVPVLNIHSKPTICHFSGFLSFESIQNLNACVLNEIAAFTHEDYISGTWQSFHRQDWLLGHRDERGVYLVTKNNVPIALNRYKKEDDPYNLPTSSSKKSNVFNLQRKS